MFDDGFGLKGLDLSVNIQRTLCVIDSIWGTFHTWMQTHLPGFSGIWKTACPEGNFQINRYSNFQICPLNRRLQYIKDPEHHTSYSIMTAMCIPYHLYFITIHSDTMTRLYVTSLQDILHSIQYTNISSSTKRTTVDIKFTYSAQWSWWHAFTKYKKIRIYKMIWECGFEPRETETKIAAAFLLMSN